MNKKLQGWILLVICNLIWSLQFTAIKLTQDQLGPYFTVWASMCIAVILLSFFVIKNFKKNKRSIKDIVRTFLPLAALGSAPAQVLMNIGTRNSLASNAAILSLILPVLTALLAFLILKEKMTKIRWICFAIAIAGVALISLDNIGKMDFGSGYVVGNLVILLALLANAYYNVGCKRIAHRFTGMEMAFYSFIFIVMLLSPFVFFYEGNSFSQVHTFTSNTWIGLLTLSVFHYFLSMVLFFIAIKHLDATDAAFSNYLIPLFGVPIAVIWLNEKLYSNGIIGGILVLLSMLILTIVETRKANVKA